VSDISIYEQTDADYPQSKRALNAITGITDPTRKNLWPHAHLNDLFSKNSIRVESFDVLRISSLMVYLFSKRNYLCQKTLYEKTKTYEQVGITTKRRSSKIVSMKHRQKFKKAGFLKFLYQRRIGICLVLGKNSK
jgi:hypothetical protein